MNVAGGSAGQTALPIAVQEGHVAVVAVLVAAGAQVDLARDDGRTPRIMAVDNRILLSIVGCL